jgi:hypothetical protein
MNYLDIDTKKLKKILVDFIKNLLPLRQSALERKICQVKKLMTIRVRKTKRNGISYFARRLKPAATINVNKILTFGRRL